MMYEYTILHYTPLYTIGSVQASNRSLSMSIGHCRYGADCSTSKFTVLTARNAYVRTLAFLEMFNSPVLLPCKIITPLLVTGIILQCNY